MALHAVIQGIQQLMKDYPDSTVSIDGSTDLIRYSKSKALCVILFHNYGVLNKYLALVFGVPEGVMSEWRRSGGSVEGLNNKVSEVVSKKLPTVISMALKTLEKHTHPPKVNQESETNK